MIPNDHWSVYDVTQTCTKQMSRATLPDKVRSLPALDPCSNWNLSWKMTKYLYSCNKLQCFLLDGSELQVEYNMPLCEGNR